MSLSCNRFLAVVYADIFDYPLTLAETRLWQILLPASSILPTLSDRLKLVRLKDGYLHLIGRERLTKWRREREEISREKKERARQITAVLGKIPTIRAIFLTGSVAAGNAKKNADIDLMIITTPNTLWLTRFCVFAILKSLKLLKSPESKRHKICPNIFLDTNHLAIKNQNLYSAHEILQTKCLYDRDRVCQKWLEANVWTAEFLPKAYKFKIKQSPISNSNVHQCPKSNLQAWVSGIARLPARRGHWALGLVIGLLVFIEPFIFILQYLYMRPKMTNERVGWGYAFFHPRDLSAPVRCQFQKRLKGLGYNDLHGTTA